MSNENEILKEIKRKIVRDLLPAINNIFESEKPDEIKRNIGVLKVELIKQFENCNAGEYNLNKIYKERNFNAVR